MKNIQEKIVWVPIAVGIILFIIGIVIQVPGGALTTHKALDGDKTSGYTFDDRYSAIDEYVGGDAYNYIIGAALVAGKISGTMTTKAVFIVGGILCACYGTTLMMLHKKEGLARSPITANLLTNSTVDTESYTCEK